MLNLEFGGVLLLTLTGFFFSIKVNSPLVTLSPYPERLKRQRISQRSTCFSRGSAMIDALEIKQKLSLVSMGKLSLDAFEDWFVPRSWNVHKDGSNEAIELVSSIHSLFSERDDRILNEFALRNELSSLLNNVSYIEIVDEPLWKHLAFNPEPKYTAFKSAPVMQVSRAV